LVLRALNDGKTAFSAFSFNFAPDEGISFFQHFQCFVEEEGSFCCKVVLRVVQRALKNLKHVLSLRMFMAKKNDVDQMLILELHCDFGERFYCA